MRNAGLPGCDVETLGSIFVALEVISTRIDDEIRFSMSVIQRVCGRHSHTILLLVR